MKNANLKIKVGDRVKVITGKDRGKIGEVKQVMPAEQLVVVDGVNQMVKHLGSQRRDEKGQRIEFNGPIHISNVMVVDPETDTPGRVGYRIVNGEDGATTKVRYNKKTNEAI